MSSGDSPVGRTGRLILASRGAEGAGEVLIRIRGGTETFIAWTDAPLPKGARVLVVESRGARTVHVVEWSPHDPSVVD